MASWLEAVDFNLHPTNNQKNGHNSTIISVRGQVTPVLKLFKYFSAIFMYASLGLKKCQF